MKKITLLMMFFLALSSCDRTERELAEAKKDVMKNSDLESYMGLTNWFYQQKNYYEVMPYALKMQKHDVGNHDFFYCYLTIRFDNKYDIKNILKLEKEEIEFLIYVLNKGAKVGETSCKEVLVEYYRNGWGVTKSRRKADSIYKSFGYPQGKVSTQASPSQGVAN